MILVHRCHVNLGANHRAALVILRGARETGEPELGEGFALDVELTDDVDVHRYKVHDVLVRRLDRVQKLVLTRSRHRRRVGGESEAAKSVEQRRRLRPRRREHGNEVAVQDVASNRSGHFVPHVKVVAALLHVARYVVDARRRVEHAVEARGRAGGLVRIGALGLTRLTVQQSRRAIPDAAVLHVERRRQAARRRRGTRRVENSDAVGRRRGEDDGAVSHERGAPKFGDAGGVNLRRVVDVLEAVVGRVKDSDAERPAGREDDLPVVRQSGCVEFVVVVGRDGDGHSPEGFGHGVEHSHGSRGSGRRDHLAVA